MSDLQVVLAAACDAACARDAFLSARHDPPAPHVLSRLAQQQTARHDQRSDWRLLRTTRNICSFTEKSQTTADSATSYIRPIENFTAAHHARTIEDNILNSFSSVLAFPDIDKLTPRRHDTPSR